MILNIGAGPSGQGDYKIDIVPYPGITDIVDIAVEPLPYNDNFFDTVEAHQVLEHVPNTIYWKEDGKFHRRYCRIEAMREIHRVLKPGGMLRASVPSASGPQNPNDDYPLQAVEWCQDPTHTGVPWNREQFSYYCHQWGGNVPGDFAHDSYGINFEFEMVKADYSGAHLHVELKKPK